MFLINTTPFLCYTPTPSHTKRRRYAWRKRILQCPNSDWPIATHNKCYVVGRHDVVKQLSGVMLREDVECRWDPGKEM